MNKPSNLIQLYALYASKLEREQMFYVGVYEVDRVCGGPEEGGWWFDTGELIISESYSNEESARTRYEELKEQYPYTKKRYSVLGGADWNVDFSTEPLPNHFPEVFPTYE